MTKEVLSMKTPAFTEECARVPEPMCTYVVIPETMTKVLEIVRIASDKQSASFDGFSLIPSNTDGKLTFRSDQFDMLALAEYFDIITGVKVTPIDNHFLIELRIDTLYEVLK